jgi:hypothetical protein
MGQWEWALRLFFIIELKGPFISSGFSVSTVREGCL